MNFHNKCVGKWTHVIRTTGASSVLDYIMTSPNITNNLQDMLIDEEREYSPIGYDKNGDPTYSDHNVIITKFDWLITEQEQIRQKDQKVMYDLISASNYLWRNLG